MSTPFDLSETDRLLSTTRAVRRRLDVSRPVEREVILDCIRLSQQAPTGGNSQGWRWMVVTDPSKRAALADLYRASSEGYLRAASEQVDERDEQTKRVYASASYLMDKLPDVPALVIPCVKGRLSKETDNATAAGLYGSILPAVWSFQLALRSRGLGSVLTTLHLQREEEAANLLGIPAHVSQVALLPVAYTVGIDFKPASRPSAESITYWDAWKSQGS